MKMMTTMALVLGLFAISTAPAAHARGDRDRDAARYSDRHEARDVYSDRHDVRHGRDLRVLTKRLKRATRELRVDARHLAGRTDYEEARAMRAIRRLDRAANELRHSVRRDGEPKHRFDRNFRWVTKRYETAMRRMDAFPRDRQLRRDIRRVDRLIGKIEREAIHRYAARRHRGHHARFAHR